MTHHFGRAPETESISVTYGWNNPKMIHPKKASMNSVNNNRDNLKYRLRLSPTIVPSITGATKGHAANTPHTNTIPPARQNRENKISKIVASGSFVPKSRYTASIFGTTISSTTVTATAPEMQLTAIVQSIHARRGRAGIPG